MEKRENCETQVKTDDRIQRSNVAKGDYGFVSNVEDVSNGRTEEKSPVEEFS